MLYFTLSFQQLCAKGFVRWVCEAHLKILFLTPHLILNRWGCNTDNKKSVFLVFNPLVVNLITEKSPKKRAFFLIHLLSLRMLWLFYPCPVGCMGWTAWGVYLPPLHFARWWIHPLCTSLLMNTEKSIKIRNWTFFRDTNCHRKLLDLHLLTYLYKIKNVWLYIHIIILNVF